MRKSISIMRPLAVKAIDTLFRRSDPTNAGKLASAIKRPPSSLDFLGKVVPSQLMTTEPVELKAALFNPKAKSLISTAASKSFSTKSSNAAPAERSPSLNSAMGYVLSMEKLIQFAEKEYGVDDGGIFEILLGGKMEQVLIKFCGVLNRINYNKAAAGLDESSVGELSGIAVRKEAICARYLYEFAQLNGIPIKIPSTGIAYEFNKESPHGIREAVASKIEKLNPIPGRDLYSYHEDLQDALLGERELIKVLHRMLPALAMIRALDPIGAAHRNLGLTTEGYLFMCDFGVGLQEVPRGKGWSKGEMKDVVGLAIPRMMGYTMNPEDELEDPASVPMHIPSERLSKAYFQSAPISVITNMKLTEEKDVEKCFDHGVKFLSSTHPNREMQEGYDEYRSTIRDSILPYKNIIKERHEHMTVLQEALNFIYPPKLFDHEHLQLPSTRIVMELYKTIGNSGADTSPEALDHIRKVLKDSIPESSKRIFKLVYHSTSIEDARARVGNSR